MGNAVPLQLNVGISVNPDEGLKLAPGMRSRL